VSSSHSDHSKRANLYARVSSAEQVEGYSLDQQIDALRAWVSLKGYKVLAEIRGEGWSAAVSGAAGLTSVILRNALKNTRQGVRRKKPGAPKSLGPGE
jgi:DNA invertase Pin-like site-specific DNA recombinase